MYVWTKKAETDFRAKYPHRPLLRKAGHEVIWEGRPILAGTILDGYISRGWIAEDGKIKTLRDGCPVKTGKTLDYREQRTRWQKLQKYLSIPGISLHEVATKMGYRSTTPIGDFVCKYGEQLAKKYGKLPYIRKIQKKYWLEVMEQKPAVNPDMLHL